jgi:hypothetical protein
MSLGFKNLISHETKNTQLRRFIIAFCLLVGYTIYLVHAYGSSGFSLGVITWSAFVMATPLPDGGVILDLPIRLLFGVRMIFSEIFVWMVAIASNVYFLANDAGVYDRTLIASSFKKILISPWPDWIIILISGAGTFLGLYFGDELLDVIFHHQRKKYTKLKSSYCFVFGIFAIMLLYFSYRYFLELFGIFI